ncbi:hypothetical protein [Schlesneria sp.]|uniref:hypothetical protein n=1 Tax=Schlesneria sp. TaxID=2762018 RepID=UPI002EFF0C9F
MYLGGFQITDVGWLGPQAVYCDFDSPYVDGWLWQLYANRTLIGSTRLPSERRVVGQLVPSISPTPLTLVRIAVGDINVDYGNQIPRQPWNRFRLRWTTSGSANVARFAVKRSAVPGGPASLFVAYVPFSGDGEYSFDPEPVDGSGVWTYAIVPEDTAGSEGAPISSAVSVMLPPDDVSADDAGKRFTVNVSAGVSTVAFRY